ncbi:unnamed protein product [Paramecium primaurelia]|uniref:EF-hand domain-containing protein n=1 Tax=Paramecium primaurelia TaxID=5886 RepID=A0A8S1PQ77_PARPR|nr:unnamed protein product [Paramecium primaurelia]
MHLIMKRLNISLIPRYIILKQLIIYSMKQQQLPSFTETGLKFKTLSHTNSLLKQISSQQISTRSNNTTVTQNNIHIAEQLKLAKAEQKSQQNSFLLNSVVQNSTKQLSNKTTFRNQLDLEEFVKFTKNKKQANLLLEKDRKEQISVMSRVREDVSHYYDPIKAERKKSDNLLDEKKRLERKKPLLNRRQISQMSSPQLSLLDMNEYLKFETSLNSEIRNLQTDAPMGRVQTIKLKEWFDKQKQDDQPDTLNLLSVTIKELIKQIKFECFERGLLIEEIWTKVVNMINDMKFQTDMFISKGKIQMLDEYATQSKIFSYEIESLKAEVKKLNEQLITENKKNHVLKDDYKELEDQFGKMRLQSNDLKKIVAFLTKKLKQANSEIELLTKKLQNEKKHRFSQVAIPHNEIIVNQSDKHQLSKQNSINNAPSMFYLKQGRNSIMPQKTDSLQNSLQSQVVKQESSSEEERDEVIEELMDDKNIIEMDNMVMNMDKIITVACFAQITGLDFLEYATKEQSCQTLISMQKSDFNYFTQSQEKFDQVFEQQKIKQNIEELVKVYEDKFKNQTSSRQLNTLIEKKFFVQKDANEMPSLTDKNMLDSEIFDESKRIIHTQVDIQQQKQHNIQQVDLEKVKTLIELLSGAEMQNKQKDQKLNEMQNSIKSLNEQIEEMKKKLSLFSEADLYNVACGKEQIKKEQKQIEQFLESQNLKSEQKITVRKRDAKKMTQAKLIFKGPQLGQKVTVVYEFQKQNAGPMLIEKIKQKQLPKIKHFMPLKLLIKQINVIYADRISQQKENSNIKEQDLASFVYSYFLSQFGIKKIAEQKFLILVVSVKHYKSIVRINNFAKFLNLFDTYVNFNLDELKRYLEAYDYITNVSQLGILNTDQDQELRYMVPYLRVVQYIGIFADSRMTSEEKEELKKELDLLKENDPKQVNKQHLIDFDQFMIQLFAKYKILVSRAKEYVINAFAACDLDGNGMCNFEEWFLLLRHIEPDRLSSEQISEIFFANADLLVKGEQNFSFEKFAVVCVEFGLFSEEAQNQFLQIKGQKTEIMSQFQKLLDSWPTIRGVIEQRFDQIVLLDADRLDQWRQIIDTLQKKIQELSSHLQQSGIEKKVKPLLIASLLLQKESAMLLELQNDYEDESMGSQLQSNQSIRLAEDQIKE